MDAKVVPCPNCAQATKYTIGWDNGYYVRCHRCGYHITGFKTLGDAYVKWEKMSGKTVRRESTTNS